MSAPKSAAGPLLDVGCVGDLCVDLVLRGDVVPRFGQTEQLVEDVALEVGGSATIFASQYAKLGGRVGIVGAVGEDAFGDFLYGQMEQLGIVLDGVARRADLKTGLSLALSKPDGDRAILTYVGSIDAVRPDDLTDELLAGCHHWHIASYFLLDSLRPVWRDWLMRCRAAKVTTSLDTNWDPQERWEGVLEALPWVDVFLPNDAEACAISGERDVEAAGRALAELGPLVVIKRGASGAVAFAGANRWELRPDPNEDAGAPIVDTIGAGDNFDAGFLRAWMLGGDVEAALRLGHRCGRASLTMPGGVRGQVCDVIRE